MVRTRLILQVRPNFKSKTLCASKEQWMSEKKSKKDWMTHTSSLNVNTGIPTYALC